MEAKQHSTAAPNEEWPLGLCLYATAYATGLALAAVPAIAHVFYGWAPTNPVLGAATAASLVATFVFQVWLFALAATGVALLGWGMWAHEKVTS